MLVAIVIPRRYTYNCGLVVNLRRERVNDMLAKAVRSDKAAFSPRLVTPTPSKERDK